MAIQNCLMTLPMERELDGISLHIVHKYLDTHTIFVVLALLKLIGLDMNIRYTGSNAGGKL